MNANDKQVGGSHYRTAEKQHWDWCVEQPVPYLEGCATKYILRWKDKNGRQDLQKALHYIDKIIEASPRPGWRERRRRRKARRAPLPFVNVKTGHKEVCAMKLVGYWTRVDDLRRAQRLIREA